MCRAVFEVEELSPTSKAAISSLPIHHFVSAVLVSTALSSPSNKSHADPNNVVCEICEENPASEYCKDCCQSFCDTCKRLHLKTRGTAHHQFISLDVRMKPGGGGAVSRITRCDKHPQQEINTYCQTDKQAICPECAIDHHKGHEVERLVNVVQGFKEEITQLVDKVCFLSSFFFFLPPPLMAYF